VGVPNAGNAALLACPASQCDQLAGGNSSLKPEVGDTRTAGIVFTPTFIDGFSATIDYFNIDVSNAIGAVPASFSLAQCYGTGASAAAVALFCPLVHRNAVGQIYGGGYVSAINQNTGFLHTKGVDIEANYSLSLDSMAMTAGYGSLQFAFVGTYTQSFQINNFPSLPQSISPTYDCSGNFGPTCGVPNPRWRHRLRTTWSTPWDVDFSANWRYISHVALDKDSGKPGLAATTFDASDHTINDFWYLDLAADWNVRSGVDLHAGVNNVFDRLPPTLTTTALPASTGNDNTFPGTYDSMGRTFFIGATIKY